MTVPVAYRVDGPPDAPVLVLSNSLGTTSEMWDPQAAALSDRFRVVRYDHRGHGASPVPPGPYAVEELGADVLALLDRLELATVSFAGLSLGGMVGMWLAAEAPSRIDRLALLCTSARLEPVEAWRDRAALVRAEGTKAVADVVAARWFTPQFILHRPGTVAACAQWLLDTEDEGYAACCELIAALDLRPLLPRITAPTLVVAGADDPATPVHHARLIADAVPGARLEIVPAAHLANVEQPDTVAELLLEHFGG